MSWAVVYTEKNSTDNRTYLEMYTYSEERAKALAKEYNEHSIDKEYTIKCCETLY